MMKFTFNLTDITETCVCSYTDMEIHTSRGRWSPKFFLQKYNKNSYPTDHAGSDAFNKLVKNGLLCFLIYQFTEPKYFILTER